MKISNIIIIAYLTLLFCGIFVLFFATKNNSLTQSEENKKWVAKEIKMESFSVLVAEPGTRLVISTGDQPKMKINYKLPYTGQYPETRIKNDTLFVFPYKGETQTKQIDGQAILYYNNVCIYTPRLKSIVGKEKSNIRFYNLIGDSLMIKLNKASLGVDSYFNELSFNYISIEAIQSKINLDGLKTKYLFVRLDSSHANNWDGSVLKVSGTLNNYSSIELEKPDKINLECDSTSGFKLTKPKLEPIAEKVN